MGFCEKLKQSEFYNKLNKRENKIILLRLWVVFKIILHTSLVVTDIISDFIYISTVDFYNESLKGFCVFFIILIPLLIYSGTLAYAIREIYKLRRNNENFQNYTIFAVFWVFIGPAISVLYPTLEKFEVFASEEYKLIFQLSTIEFFGESLPQLMIQGINNSLTNNWTSFTKFSFTISFMSLIRGCYVFATTFYRRQYQAYLASIFEKNKTQIYDKVKQEIIANSQNDEELLELKLKEIFDRIKQNNIAYLSNHEKLQNLI